MSVIRDKKVMTERVDIGTRTFMVHRNLCIDLAYGADITAFYQYTSSVLDRVVEVEYKHNDDFDLLRENMVYLANKNCGIKAYVDNKTVFEVTRKNGQKMYLGWYDNTFSIGLGVRSEHEPRVREDNTTKGGN